MSLRARLLVGLISLALVGLVVAGAVTYTSLRAFLLGRVDDQLVDARVSVVQALRVPGRLPLPIRPREGIRTSLPPGTYGEVRGRDGTTLDTVSVGFGDDFEPPPRLPGTLPGSGDPAGSRTFTAGAAGTGTSYRVLAESIRGGGTLVVAIPLGEVQQTLRRLLLVEFLVAGGVLAGLAGLGLWVVRLGLRPLERIGATAGAIAAGDLSRRVEPAEARTEVGRLGLALNAMLGQIERAFAERRASEDRLRRFLADASHELRTPLTSIRGYAELFRRGAGDRPEDLAASMRRIEEEAARMGVLVDDLLLLARLDEGRPLAREPVDLGALAADAAADARAADPGRPITVEAGGSVVVEGDDLRLRQVAANLLSNARTHTPPGTPVHVRVLPVDGTAVLEVADEGPGLAPEEAARVFERFYRGDPSRSRSSGGSGLGLSIVDAVVRAHGGTVEVDTAPGRGATFRVRLPWRDGALPAGPGDGEITAPAPAAPN